MKPLNSIKVKARQSIKIDSKGQTLTALSPVGRLITLKVGDFGRFRGQTVLIDRIDVKSKTLIVSNSDGQDFETEFFDFELTN